MSVEAAETTTETAKRGRNPNSVQAPAKPDESLRLCPEAADLLRQIIFHSDPHHAVLYRASKVAELVDSLRTVLAEKQGLQYEVE